MSVNNLSDTHPFWRALAGVLGACSIVLQASCTPVYTESGSGSGTTAAPGGALYRPQTFCGQSKLTWGNTLALCQDFGRYSNGDFPAGWGANLSVLREGARRWLTTLSPSSQFLVKRVAFPQNFVFSFDVRRLYHRKIELLLYDADEHPTKYILKCETVTGSSWCDHVLPRTVKRTTSYAFKKVNRVKLVKRGTTLKTYVNGEFGSSMQLTGAAAKRFTGFRIRIDTRLRVTNIQIRRMGP